jgi:UDP-N-acetylmuramate dehydrogenase
MKKAYGYHENFDLSKRSSIRLGPIVDAFMPHSEEDLIELLSFLASEGRSYVIAGGLSNLLPCEEPDRYAYVFTDRLGNLSWNETQATLGAGCRLGASILRLAREGVYILPSLVGILGTFGGAIFSNAGAFGEQIADRVIRCRVFDPRKKAVRTLSAEEMHFAYRHSILKEQPLVLLEVDVSLGDALTADSFQTHVREVKRRRATTQPHEPSLGCVFKAHEGVSLGYYLDRLGMKGFTSLGIAVSEIHAGFLVNRGGSIEGMKRMIQYLKEEILKAYGFLPEEEIQIL